MMHMLYRTAGYSGAIMDTSSVAFGAPGKSISQVREGMIFAPFSLCITGIGTGSHFTNFHPLAEASFSVVSIKD